MPSRRLLPWPRLVLIATLGAFIYMCLCIFKATQETSEVPLANKLGGKWKDPNNDLINEPPEPLVRARGNNYSPGPGSDRINATIISLVRNRELGPLLQSMRDLERTWNRKFNYPWTFFNDEPFTERFKVAVSKETNAEVFFAQIPSKHWDVPTWIDRVQYRKATEELEENGVQYASKKSYHQMCRWNSGMFLHHPILADKQFYWRVEPNVHFFCDIDYDVFRFMQDHNKTYGFTINLYDEPASIPSLWAETEQFLSKPENSDALHPNSAQAWVQDRAHRPDHYDKAGGYSTCHFWSNFEIANLDFWRSDLFQRYFTHLDRTGGFFYERWGDAPVHSLALGLFEDRRRIHWFRDIGYQHIPFFNCPKRPIGKCRGCEAGRLTDGEPFLYKEDCRPSWFAHVGLGSWAGTDDAV